MIWNNLTIPIFHSLNKSNIKQLEGGSVPPFTNRGLKFAHLNIHSLVAKIDELRLLLRNASFDVIGLNETFCDSMIDDSELYIDDYILLRRDRTRHGGGVAVYISKRFNYKRRDDLISSTLECLWFELHYPNKSPILVGEFYRPPNSHVDFFEELDGNLDSALSEDMSCIILGDFNCDCMPHQLDLNAEKLMFYTNMYGLSQLIDTATRVTNTSSTLIDLIFVSDKELYNEWGIFETSISDHYLVYTVRDFSAKIHNKSEYAEFRSFKNLDEEKFYSELRSTPWQVIKDIDNVDVAWDMWLTLFNNIRHWFF